MTLQLRDRQQVTAWRRSCLVSSGFPPQLASQLARDPRLDLHALVELVERGCPPALAARIVSPLEEDAA